MVRPHVTKTASWSARPRLIEEGSTISPEPVQSTHMPDDEFNQELVGNVHPSDWPNPRPAGRYNLVVLGAGTAGLVTAAVAAGLGGQGRPGREGPHGRRLPERRLRPVQGAAPRLARLGRPPRASDFGARVSGRRCNSRLRRGDGQDAAASCEPQPQRLAARRFTSLGVDVFLGEGRFTGPDTVQVGDASLRFSKAAICTGARAASPEIPGIGEAGYLTNETVFNLTELPASPRGPRRGPIGCELAQAFARFGSRVTVIERSGVGSSATTPRPLESSRTGCRAMAWNSSSSPGCSRVERRAEGKVLCLETRGATSERVVDEILVGVGRAPNVEGLGLETVGVDSRRQDGRRSQQSAPDHQPADLRGRRRLLPLQVHPRRRRPGPDRDPERALPPPARPRLRDDGPLVIPWCTYTDPELAHVGMSAEGSRRAGNRDRHLHRQARRGRPGNSRRRDGRASHGSW